MDRRIILWIILVTAADNSLSEALATLLNPSNVEDFIQCAVQLAWDPEALPPTSLLYPSFNEDIPKTADLAEYLWRQCFYYALPRRKQAKLAEDMRADPSRSLDTNRIIRSFFMDFSAKNPARSSEVGEVIAYSVVQHYLRAPQKPLGSNAMLRGQFENPTLGRSRFGHRSFSGAGTVTVHFWSFPVCLAFSRHAKISPPPAS
ncbi:Hachiman antiphage defense system protein HamA [Sinorhizobium meliloti]|uniref:Hachiman antiphage defense system protein HamA n=1 Tax=Rhizobium meliloti TaxID=382 RepID=UPI0013147418